MMKVDNPKSKVGSFLPWQTVIAFCLLLAAFGCGYTIHGRSSLPFDAIQIGRIENRTLEPKLQDMLYRALTEEFLKEGIGVQSQAGYKLSGAIKRFDLKVLSEKSDVASEYEVVIRGDFQLTDPSGNVQDFKGLGSPFIVSLAGSGGLNELIANKELASERAVRDMAMEIVAALLYR